MDLPEDSPTGERLLFWTAAKALCRERRRERKDQARQARRQSLQRVLIPTEIGVSDTTTSRTITTIPEEDLRFPANNNNNSDDDNHDDDSCVSDVTRELPDLFECTTMYPSLSCLDDAEASDLELSKRSLGTCSTLPVAGNTMESDPAKQEQSCNDSPVRPLERRSCCDSSVGQNTVTNESPFFPEGHKLGHTNNNNRFQKNHDSHLPMFDTQKDAGQDETTNANKKGSTPRMIQPKLTLKSSIVTTALLRRSSSETLPALPQRRLSLDSQTSSQVDYYYEARPRFHTAVQPKECPATLERRGSTSSPVLPKRRLSLDSLISSRVETDDADDDDDLPGTPQVPPEHPAVILRRVYQEFLPQDPSWEELGYEETTPPPVSGHPPPAPCRRHSLSSVVDQSTVATQDDNSTIATWTLGLYRRRKSLDSTVAEPLPPNAGKYDDTPPARPRRSFSAGSLQL